MTKLRFATGVSSASLHSCYSITNGAKINGRGLFHVQSPSIVKSPSKSISGRHCWVMINVVTGARGGVVERNILARRSSCLLHFPSRSSDELRGQGWGLFAIGKALEPKKPPAPKRKLQLPCQTQFEREFSTCMLDARSRRQLTHAFLAVSEQIRLQNA